jgi:hypothetical protein
VVAHLTGWPRKRTRTGLPWLQDCEGLGPELMPFYNPILYFSGTAALAALLLENRSAPRHLPLVTLPLVLVLIAGSTSSTADSRRSPESAQAGGTAACSPSGYIRSEPFAVPGCER